MHQTASKVRFCAPHAANHTFTDVSNTCAVDGPLSSIFAATQQNNDLLTVMRSSDNACDMAMVATVNRFINGQLDSMLCAACVNELISIVQTAAPNGQHSFQDSHTTVT